MNRLIKILAISITLCLILNVSVFAEDSSEYTFCYTDKTITIENNGLEYEKAKTIADNLYYGTSDSTAYGIACIFGHNLETSTVTQTSHKVHSTSPMCERNTYDVSYCTRSSCNYTKETLIDTTRIVCCG